MLDLFKEVVSCIEVGRRLPQAEDVCQGARKRLRKMIDLISGHGGPPDGNNEIRGRWPSRSTTTTMYAKRR